MKPEIGIDRQFFICLLLKVLAILLLFETQVTHSGIDVDGLCTTNPICLEKTNLKKEFHGISVESFKVLMKSRPCSRKNVAAIEIFCHIEIIFDAKELFCVKKEKAMETN